MRRNSQDFTWLIQERIGHITHVSLDFTTKLGVELFKARPTYHASAIQVICNVNWGEQNSAN